MRKTVRDRHVERQQKILDLLDEETQATQERESLVAKGLHRFREQPEARERASELRAARADLAAAFEKIRRLD